MRTIIFLSGMGVPTCIAKTKYVWNHSLWKDYRCIYLTSHIPTSDKMVSKHLKKLNLLINQFSNVIVAGQSLGAWWAANLACEKDCQMKKIVLLTPLCDANQFPIFNVSKQYHPINRQPNKHNTGPHRSLILSALDDLIVPPVQHANVLDKHYNSTYYKLDGGHFFQKNHAAALSFTKDWIELD